MFTAETAQADLVSAMEQILHRRRVASIFCKVRQAAQASRHVEMLGTENLAVDLHRPAVERFSFNRLARIAADAGKRQQASSRPMMLHTVRGDDEINRLGANRPGLVEAVLAASKLG